MPQPTNSDVHVNRPLTNVSVATMQKATNFIASRAFPTVPVAKQSDAYFLYDNAFWNTDQMKKRGPGAETPGSGYEIDSSNTYFADVWGVHKDVADQIRANSDAPINLDREATDFVTMKALIRREKEFVSTAMTAAVWTRDYDGVSASPSTSEVLQWNDASSTPIEDISDARYDIMKLTGYEPNKLILGAPVYKELINHSDIIDRLKAGQTPGGPAMANAVRLAQIFEVDEVLVMKAIENTAAEKAASASHDFIGGKDALLVYAPPAPGVMTPSAGYTFVWTGLLGAGPQGNRITRFRMDALASDRVELEIAFDIKLISANLGAFWDGVVA